MRRYFTLPKILTTLLVAAISLSGMNVALSVGAENESRHRNDALAVGCEDGTAPLAFSTGPPDARTGAPGEATCNSVFCHSSFPLNSGNGSFSILVGASYLPGETLTVNINLQDPGQMRWGFELTALDSLNQPAGQAVITDPARTQVTGLTRRYIKHTSIGTDPGVSNTAPGWSFDWIAPAAPLGPVTFYAAGNAANNNLLNSGDFIYTTSQTVTENNADSDNDGLTDAQESVLGTNPNLMDSDGDGVPDGVEVGNPAAPTDTDADGVINALDDDDDGDNVLTLGEDINADSDPTNDDTDGDGAPNYLDSDDDNDTTPTRDEDPNQNGDPTDDDTDVDGAPNYLDDDDDGDGVLSAVDGCPLIPDPCPQTCCTLPGNANGDTKVNIADVTFLIARIFAAGNAPSCCEEASANGDNKVNIADVTFLIARIFAAGAAPICGPSGMGC